MASPGVLRICRAASIPLMPGISRSINTRSKRFVPASSASVALIHRSDVDTAAGEQGVRKLQIDRTVVDHQYPQAAQRWAIPRQTPPVACACGSLDCAQSSLSAKLVDSA